MATMTKYDPTLNAGTRNPNPYVDTVKNMDESMANIKASSGNRAGSPIATTQYGTGMVDPTGRGAELGGPGPMANSTMVPNNPTLNAGTPNPEAPAAPAAKKDYTPAEAAAQGVGWVPTNHPLYGTKGFVGYQDPGATNQVPAAGGPAPTTPNIPTPAPGASPTTPQTPQSPDQQAQAAKSQTMSTTPGAAPTENTTNQGGQDVLRNALISQMTSNPIPSVEDPAIRAQLDPFAAAQERARQGEVRAGAESAFAGGQSYGNPEKMAAAERAGQATGLRASDLVGQELGARRQQVQQALTQFGSMISDDQRRALEKRAQDLDNQIRQQGLAQTGQLGNRELDIRDKLGMAGANTDLMRVLNQNTQFGQDLGFRIGDAQARYNNAALQQVMGG